MSHKFHSTRSYSVCIKVLVLHIICVELCSKAFKTSDGWLVIGAGNDKLFKSLCDRIGHAELASDKRFSSNGLRVSNKEDLIEILCKL